MEKQQYAYILPVPDPDVRAVEAGFFVADVILLATMFDEYVVVRDC